jgi:hypothetical protein
MAGLFLCGLSAARARMRLRLVSASKYRGPLAVRVFLALPSLADAAQNNMQGPTWAFAIHQGRQRGRDQRIAEIFDIRK